MKRLYQLFALFIFIVMAGIIPGSQVSALSASDWRAGNIIDDSIFFDSNAMSVAEIQAFLNSLVPTCDTWGVKMYGSITRAQWGINNGTPAPFICLKDYYENPITHETNFNPTASIPTGGISAAQIIYNAARQYNISPKVLLVTIKKEALLNLIEDDWPILSQYRSALGFACPDTAPCDSQYYGFYNQVTNSAKQFRLYADYPDSYRRKAGQTYFIQYNPNTLCSGADVFVENQATAGLYNYTPYQPNPATISWKVGSGSAVSSAYPGCGAFGNINFWTIWNGWFGDTHTPDYSWRLINQYVYTDSTKSTSAGLANLLPGERRYIGFTIKNTGNATWTNSGANPLNLGTSNPYERQSKFYDSTWLSPSRPATLKESSVAPGETGTFEFWINAPAVTSTTTFNEYFTPLAEGKVWLPNIGLFYGITVQKPVYTWSLSSQYAFTDETKATPLNMGSLLPGQRVYVGFTAKNTGNMTWKNSGVNALMAGTLSPYERQSKFSTGSNWLTGTRPTLMKESSVAPGETGTFEFWLTIPNSSVSGVYNERFGLIANNLTWLNDTGLSYYMNIQPTRYTWSLSSQYAYTDSTKSTPLNMNALLPGQRIYIGFTAKNTGNMAWKNSGGNALMAGTLSPYERQSKFYDSTWPSATRPAVLKEASVAPGGTGTFEFWMTIPSSGVSGVYNERFGLIANDLTWLNDTGLSYYMNVR